jgi:hypothetical protein
MVGSNLRQIFGVRVLPLTHDDNHSLFEVIDPNR